MESVLTSAISNQGKNDDIDTFGEGNIEQQMAVSDRLSIVILNNTGGSNFVGRQNNYASKKQGELELNSFRAIIRILPLLASRPLVDL